MLTKLRRYRRRKKCERFVLARLPPIELVDPVVPLTVSPAPLFPFTAGFPADDGDDVDEIDGFNRFAVDLLVSGTVLFAAVISEFSPTRTLHAGFDHVKTFDPNLFGSGFFLRFVHHIWQKNATSNQKKKSGLYDEQNKGKSIRTSK